MGSNTNVKCSVCGKTITGNFQYIDTHRPVCGFCWETFYDGVRYLPASTRHKLQEALQKAAGEVTELEDRVEKLRTETTKVTNLRTRIRGLEQERNQPTLQFHEPQLIPLKIIEEFKRSQFFEVCDYCHLTSDDAEWGRFITEIDFPPSLIRKLNEIGINRLFKFQDQALQKICSGRDTVILAPTANGKTEAFMLPIISQLALHPEDKCLRVLLIYPTNALIHDQFRKIKSLAECVGLRTACFIGIGETPQEDRQEIFRNPPSILLTNIDTIHANLSKSNDKDKFKELIRSTRFIVFDEIHKYVGTFGSHAHMILKRLKRLLESSPVVVGASATLSNAPKFVEDFFGPGTEIITCGKPRKYSLHLAMVYSNIPFQNAITHIVEKLNREKIKTLVFANDHKTSETTVRALQRAGIDAGLHRGGMAPESRRQTEESFRDNSLKVLVATPTMELGVDIGSLDAVISPIINYTRILQRIGRAGREGQESIAIILLRKGDAISEFYHRFPKKFSEDEECLYFEPRNFIIQKDQLLAAAADEPLYEREMEESLPLLEELRRDGFLIRDNTPARRFVITGNGKNRLFQYNIRGASKTAQIIDVDTGIPLGIGREFPMATRELHPGAIYSLEGQTYRSIDLDVKQGVAKVRREQTEQSTVAHYEVEAKLLKTEERKRFADFALELGRVSVTETVVGYYVFDFNGKFLKEEKTNPVEYTFETKGISFQFALPSKEKRATLLHTLAHLTVLSGAQITGGELREFGYFFDESGRFILYESTPGGNGLLGLLLTRLKDFLNRILLILQECQHEPPDCPCVYLYYCPKRNANLDKRSTRDFLTKLLKPVIENIDKVNEGFKPIEEPFNSVADSLDVPLMAGAFIADDGHRVRSRGELLIDNWLYYNKILHVYEKPIWDSTGAKMRCDFYLLENKLFIEYWGLETEEYRKRRKEKEKIYQELSLSVANVENKDIYDLEAHLRNMLTHDFHSARNITEVTKSKEKTITEQQYEEKVQKIINIIEEIVEGCKRGPPWVRNAGDHLLQNMKQYAERNDVDSIYNYYERLATGTTGKPVGEWLKSKNLPSIESEFEKVKQIYKDC